MVINKIVNLIAKQFKLYDTMKRLDKVEQKVDILIKDSHPKRDFVKCKKCGREIDEANKLTQSLGDETL